MSPLILITPILWVLQGIITLFVALFSAITGNYYAAVPRDGGQPGVIAYVPANAPGELPSLRLQLADGTVFVGRPSDIATLAASESDLLKQRDRRSTLALATLTASNGAAMRCEFALDRTTRSSVGVCRDGGGRFYDIRS